MSPHLRTGATRKTAKPRATAFAQCPVGVRIRWHLAESPMAPHGCWKVPLTVTQFVKLILFRHFLGIERAGGQGECGWEGQGERRKGKDGGWESKSTNTDTKVQAGKFNTLSPHLSSHARKKNAIAPYLAFTQCCIRPLSPRRPDQMASGIRPIGPM